MFACGETDIAKTLVGDVARLHFPFRPYEADREIECVYVLYSFCFSFFLFFFCFYRKEFVQLTIRRCREMPANERESCLRFCRLYQWQRYVCDVQVLVVGTTGLNRKRVPSGSDIFFFKDIRESS